MSCAAVGSAAADPVIDLGLGGVKVPQIDLPTVKPPTIDSSGIKPPSVDVQPTVDSATNTVNTIAGGGNTSGGGNTGGSTNTGGNPGTGTPTAPTAPTNPTAPTPSTPQSDQPNTSPGGSSDSGKSNTTAKGENATAGDNGGPNAAGARNGARAGAKKGNGGDKAAGNPKPAATDRPSTLIRVVEAFSWTIFGVLLAIALLALGMTGRSATLARLTRKLKQQRGELTSDVGAMQTALLPKVPSQIGSTAFSVAYRSVGPASGGDFHDVVELDGGLIGVLVGDACGHGRDALHTTALVHYTVRAYLEAGLEPREAIRLADEKVGGKLGGDFVTVLCAVYDPRQSSLTYATAGHPAPIVIGGPGDQSISLLTDPPIGVGSPSGNRQTRISVPEGCELCFFSDGLTEARTEGGGCSAVRA